jgi:hypothetical protein
MPKQTRNQTFTGVFINRTMKSQQALERIQRVVDATGLCKTEAACRLIVSAPPFVLSELPEVKK